MTDNDLPPERRLPDEVRAQRKADLMRRVAGERRTGRRWLVPAAAAAAVVALVALGGAVLADGDDGDPRPTGPAGSVPAEPTAPPDTPRKPPPDVPAPPRGELASSAPTDDFVDPDELPPDPPQPCGELRIPIRGATEIAAIPIGETSVRLYGNDDTWIVCDEWAALDGSAATLLRPHGFGEPIDQAQLGISMNFSMTSDQGEYVAGGALPDDVEAITYTFSDGHVEDAVLADGMWAMAYFTEGSPQSADVEVRYAGGRTDRFTLREPMDFCTQSNHGC